MKRNEVNYQKSAEEFRKQQSRHHKSKLIESDFHRSQKVCYQLDQAKGYTEPIEIWFWPKIDENDDNVNDSDHDGEPIKDEKQISSDSEDEEASLTEISLSKVKRYQAEMSYADNRALVRRDIISKEDASSEFMLEEQLQIINEYLRSQYLYCLWCGITFSDNEDFNSNCPGSTRDDHE